MTLDTTQRPVGCCERVRRGNITSRFRRQTRNAPRALRQSSAQVTFQRACKPCASHAFASAATPCVAVRRDTNLDVRCRSPCDSSPLETGSLATRLARSSSRAMPLARLKPWQAALHWIETRADDRGRLDRGAAAVAAVDKELRDFSHRGSHMHRGAQICRPHARAWRPSCEED